MKNKILALLATIGMVSSVSAVEINENISINGFIDASYVNSDFTDKSAPANNNDISNSAVDEVELNFIVNAGNVDGELHIDSTDAADDRTLEIEQVHFTYSFENGASLKVGRFGSALGFEREDPAGLYTFSRAYGTNTYDLGNVDNDGNAPDNGNVFEGFNIGYAAESFALSLAVGNDIAATEEDNANEDDYDYELAITYTGIENLSVTVGTSTENTSDPKVGTANADTDLYTINAAYTINKLLLGGEYISTETDGAQDLSAYMLIADYDITDTLGAALRYSEWEGTNGTATTETDKVTFAANYAITESLGAIVEFSTEELSGGANAGDETDSFAVELTYTF